MAILPVWAPVCQSLQGRAMRTFESDVGEDDFVVRFGIVFCGYPFEPWRDGVLSFHCSGTVFGAAVGLRISSCSHRSWAADFNALVLIRGDRDPAAALTSGRLTRPGLDAQQGDGCTRLHRATLCAALQPSPRSAWAGRTTDLADLGARHPPSPTYDRARLIGSSVTRTVAWRLLGLPE